MTQELLGEAAENKEKQVTLPHDAMIEEKRAASHSTGTGGGFFPGADYEYTRTLHVDADEKSQSFFLEFEGIYNRGYIFVNEELLGSTHYGYTGKIVDITPALRFGEDNVICVKAVNTDAPNSRWYTGSGMCTPWSLSDSVSSWTWNGYEGKPCRVEVYSDAPKVELFVNGVSKGILPCGEENRFRAIFDTTYEPGEICAKACYVDGQTESFGLKTASGDLQIAMAADRSEVCADDLFYVTIELRDQGGNLMTCADRKVALKIDGPGCIQGFGSADPMSEENFFDSERKTWYGRLIAVVRAGEDQGTIRLTAEAEGLEPAVLELQVG